MRKRMRSHAITIVVTICVILAFILGGYLAQRSSYSDQRQACASNCKLRGKIGHLVKQVRPYSPKPSNEVFDCICS
jgi:hypothetical protein